MKEMLQNFGSIICNLAVNLAGFRDVGQNTPCPVCHPAMACLPYWCCWTMVPDGVIQHNFYKNGVILHACAICAWGWKDFFQVGVLVDFSKSFLGGPKVVKFVFTTRS